MRKPIILKILKDKPELGLVAVHEPTGRLVCCNCSDFLDQDLPLEKPLDTLCITCRWEIVARRMLERLGDKSCS